jgi:hypothetical protein
MYKRLDVEGEVTTEEEKRVLSDSNNIFLNQISSIA